MRSHLNTDVQAGLELGNFRYENDALPLGHSSSYHPPSQSDQYYLDTYNSTYEKSLLVGDFNAEEREACLMDFMYQYDLKNLVKEKTCFKSIENPSCIDIFLTNHPKCFHHTKAISCGISDFHKMIFTIVNTTFCKPNHNLYITEAIKILIRIHSELNLDKNLKIVNLQIIQISKISF